MLAALILAILGCGGPRSAATPSSAIVIVLDDVASADLALYGGPVETPYLSQLAARGVRFTNAYGMATCAPARRSLLTGHWWTGESGDKCGPIVPEWPSSSEVFLPEALGIPSAIFGKWHLGGVPGVGVGCAPLAHGFQFWISGLPSNVSECGGTDYTNWVRASSSTCGLSPSSSYAPQEIATSFRTNWAASSGPRLAYVGAPLPHGPFHAPPANLLPANYPQIVTKRQKYEAMIRVQDTLLGQMLAGVDLEDTLVVVIADNGTPTQVAPDPTKAKTTVYERGVHVPLIIAGGAVVAPGRSSDALVSIVDVYATVLESLGSAVPTSSGPYPVVSVSAVPVLQNTASTVRTVALVGTGHGNPGAERGAVNTQGRKLRSVDTDGDGVYETEMLFDLVADPSETVDVGAQQVYASDLATLRAFIAAEALP